MKKNDIDWKALYDAGKGIIWALIICAGITLLKGC